MILFACVCSYSSTNTNNIEHSRRRRYNRHESSERRHAANGNGTARAGSITNSTSASKRQKKTENLPNNTKNHVATHFQKNRSTSTPNRRVSLFISHSVKFIAVIQIYVGVSYILNLCLQIGLMAS